MRQRCEMCARGRCCSERHFFFVLENKHPPSGLVPFLFHKILSSGLIERIWLTVSPWPLSPVRRTREFSHRIQSQLWSAGLAVSMTHWTSWPSVFFFLSFFKWFAGKLLMRRYYQNLLSALMSSLFCGKKKKRNRTLSVFASPQILIRTFKLGSNFSTYIVPKSCYAHTGQYLCFYIAW